MILASLFLLFLIAVILVWFGWREESIFVFAITFLCAVGTFIHHMTDVIGLSL